MTYEFYKVLHLTGIFMVLMSLAAACLHMAGGGSKESFTARKLAGMTHGIGLLISFVAGFGLLAKLGLKFSDSWVLAKFAIWIVFGGLTAVIYKKPQLSRGLWFLIILLAAAAAFLARYKPF